MPNVKEEILLNKAEQTYLIQQAGRLRFLDCDLEMITFLRDWLFSVSTNDDVSIISFLEKCMPLTGFNRFDT